MAYCSWEMPFSREAGVQAVLGKGRCAVPVLLPCSVSKSLCWAQIKKGPFALQFSLLKTGQVLRRSTRLSGNMQRIVSVLLLIHVKFKKTKVNYYSNSFNFYCPLEKELRIQNVNANCKMFKSFLKPRFTFFFTTFCCHLV